MIRITNADELCFGIANARVLNLYTWKTLVNLSALFTDLFRKEFSSLIRIFAR